MADAKSNGAPTDRFQVQQTAIVCLASPEPDDLAVVLQAIGRHHSRGIGVIDDRVGQLAGFGEYASDLNRFLFGLGNLELAHVVVLPGEHGLVGNLPSFAFSQFAGRHEAIGDVMPVTRWRVFNPGNVLVASH
ncbi:hypothetical protein D3C85_1089390 [compost metagenome]